MRAGELEPAAGQPLTLSISNRYGEDEVVHSLRTESREALQSWREALWQLFFDMSKCVCGGEAGDGRRPALSSPGFEHSGRPWWG